MKKIFIGGLDSSGTTITLNTILSLGFATGTGKFREGQHDPNHPKALYKFTDSFDNKDKLQIDSWINNFCDKKTKYFIEKTPGHFACFPALYEMYGKDAHFIMLKRNPHDVVSSATRRWGPQDKERYGVIFERVIQVDHIMVGLDNFQYLKYEDLCNHPFVSIKKCLGNIGIFFDDDILYKKVRKMNISKKNTYSESKHLEIKNIDILAKKWGY